jgi:exopolysaccharide biosynthesis polyprenyl glycosylphosphotransferase
MLKQKSKLLRKILIFIDLAAIASSFLLAYYLRLSAGAVGEIDNYVWLLLFALPGLHFLLKYHGLYNSLRIRSYTDTVWAVFKAHVLGSALFASILFMVAPHHYSRLLFVSFMLSSFITISVGKIVIKLVLGCIRKKGYNFKNVLIIGEGKCAEKIFALITLNQNWGLNAGKMVAVTGDGLPFSEHGVPRVGSIVEIMDMCKKNMVDEVVFALENGDPFNVGVMLQGLQELGVTARVIVNNHALYSVKPEVSLFHGLIPMITYSTISLNSEQRLFKRCIDVVGALAGLSLCVLLAPFIFLAIKMDSSGPLFFGQKRVRENGRHFTCWKFRTMHANAEAEKKNLMALNEMGGAMFKIKNDPRVTLVGRFLRKFSIDEFPQFWNVLIGEMSLVGTRPPTPDEVAGYQNWHRKRIAVKPGITGLWQVSGRNQIKHFDDVVRLDLAYIETWSIWLDIKIIMKTPWVMMSREGAS